MMTSDTDTEDQVVRTALVAAPRARVWKAISEVAAFSAWFGGEDMTIEGTIAPGERLTSRFGDGPPEPFGTILSVEPETAVVFRWVPFEPPPGSDPESLMHTQVVIALSDHDGGTLVTVTESGFAALPPEHRSRAARNGDGWAIAVQGLAQYLIGRVTVSVRTRLPSPLHEARALMLAQAGCPDPGSGSVVHLRFEDEVVDCDVGYANEHLLMVVWRVGGLSKVTLALSEIDGDCHLTISEAPFCLEPASVQRALAQTERWTRFGMRLARDLEGLQRVA
ncbi:MAG TPA: SRPBCC domain-containing protein [Myxococcota bacterium]|nr:SRPBCC domain-containing protein [Myxococcota bacterium]